MLGNNDNIEIVSCFKYLGVQVDKHFKWDGHIENVKKQALPAFGLVKYSKKYLSPEVLAKMYRGLVEPHLSYYCSVLGNCSKGRNDSLQKVQNRAAKIIMNSAYDASVAPLIQSLGWPTISSLIPKETATSLNELSPQYVRNLFTRCSDSNGCVHRSIDTDLKLPLLKTSAGQKSFSYRGARLWNSLSRET